jgi:phenylacetic acid degradation protein PaaD
MSQPPRSTTPKWPSEPALVRPGTGVGVTDSVARMMAADAASRALGIDVVEAAHGVATATMTVRADMVNGHGITHGAFVFAVADTAFACACNSHGPLTVAASVDITFVAPSRAGDVLEARAVERTRFGRSGIYDVTVRRGDDVIAEFRGTSRTLGREAV